MKEGWTYKKLGEVCESLNGLWKGKKPPYMNVGVIRNANFTKDFTLNFDNIEYLDVEEKQYSKRKLRAGDIIVEKSGGSDKQPVGRAVLFDKSEGEYSFSNFTSVLRIKDQNEIYSAFLYKYLLYVYLGGATKKMQKATTGIHNLEFQQYLNIDVPCIEMGVQQRIVERLDSAFENIDKLKANAEKQLAEAQTLFQKSLAKAMEPKEGWEEKKMSEIYDVRDGTHDSPKYHETGFPLVTSKNLRGGILDMSNVNFISESDYNAINQRSKVDVGDVLFAMIGTIGNPVYVEKEPGYAIKNMALFKVPEYHSGKFLKYYLQNEVVLSKMQEEAKGTTQKFVSLGYLRNSIISIPPLPVQQRIVERLDALSENIRKYEEIQRQIISECDALKQALLRKVFE